MKGKNPSMGQQTMVRAFNRPALGVRVERGSELELLGSAALTTSMVPVLLFLNVSTAVALPLALLTGLASHRIFRLLINPAGNDIFFPATMVVGYFLIYFGLRSFYLATAPFFERLGLNAYDDYLPAALWCACLGYIAFSAGIASKQAEKWLRKRPPLKDDWPASIPTFRLFVMIMVGLGCLLYLFKIGMAVGNYGNLEFQRHPPPGLAILFEKFLDLAWIAICIFVVVPDRKSDRGFTWAFLGISLITLCAKLAISGGKIALIQPLIAAAIVFHYGKRRFRIWEMMVFGVPVLALAFGVVNFYRFVVVGQQGSPKSISDVISRVSAASDLLGSKHEAAAQTSALEQMVGRDEGVDALALIMKYTPARFPYVHGVHWLDIPLTLIPRAVWKDKPINIPSAEFESTYMGLPASYNGFTSMHLISDLYRNFSYPGVFCGMFLFGLILRGVYLFCSPSVHNRTGLFLYAALFPEIIHSLESDVGYAVGVVSRVAFLAILAAFFLGGGYRKLRRVKVAPVPMARFGRPKQVVGWACPANIISPKRMPSRTPHRQAFP